MEDKASINVDLLIVTDHNDYLRLYALHIVCALHSVYKNYTAEIRRIYNVDTENESFTCKKILFITWGFSEYTKVKITNLLNEISIKTKRRFIINVTGDAYGKPLETLDVNNTEFCDKNKLKVHKINHVEQWWPQTVQFLLNVSKEKRNTFKYHVRRSESIFKETVCSCLDYFNIFRSDEALTELEGCNIGLVSELPKPDEEGKNTVYLSDHWAANPGTENQYKWDQLLLFITRVYVKTGVINSSCWKHVKARLYQLLQIFANKGVPLRVFSHALVPILCVTGTALLFRHTGFGTIFFMQLYIFHLMAAMGSLFTFRRKNPAITVVPCILTAVFNVVILSLMAAVFNPDMLLDESDYSYKYGIIAFDSFIIFISELAVVVLNVIVAVVLIYKSKSR